MKTTPLGTSSETPMGFK